MLIKSNEWEISKNAVLADSFWSRAIGLMFQKEMRDFDGMLLKPSNSIHTFGMFFSIDVVFLNKKYEVIKILENLKPYRMTKLYFGASQVLELNAGTLQGRLRIGDRLEVTCIN